MKAWTSGETVDHNDLNGNFNTVFGQANPYTVGLTQPGTTGNAQIMLWHTLPVKIGFPGALAGSSATARVAATGSPVFVLAYRRSGVSTTIASFTFSGTTAAISGVVLPTLAVGDVLTLTGPATADATLADIGFTLVASKQ